MSLSKISRVLQRIETPEIGEKPNQPKNYKFPSREFGKKVVVKRSFQENWFSHFPWLHYDVHKDAAFCFICIRENLSQSVILNPHIFPLVTQIGKMHVLNFKTMKLVIVIKMLF